MKKESRFKEGDICEVMDFQEFGKINIVLVRRITKNIDGKLMKEPLWEGRIIKADNKKFQSFILSEPNLSLIAEEKLIKLNNTLLKDELKEIIANYTHEIKENDYLTGQRKKLLISIVKKAKSLLQK